MSFNQHNNDINSLNVLTGDSSPAVGLYYNLVGGRPTGLAGALRL